MFKCAGPKAATWGRDGGCEHSGGRGERPENAFQFLLPGSLGFMFFCSPQDVCKMYCSTILERGKTFSVPTFRYFDLLTAYKMYI